MPNQKNRWEPESEAFERLLAFLHADRDKAGEEYEVLRWRLTTYFEHRNCLDADELTDEVLNRLMRRLEEGEVIQEPLHYCYGIAKWVDVEYQRKAQRHGGSVDDLPPMLVELKPFNEQGGGQTPLKTCLQELPEADRQLFLQYFCQEDLKNKQARKALADSLQLTPLALRLRVYRIKARLAACLTSRSIS